MDTKNNMTVVPKISIIVPVYNVVAYLEQCLDSCIRQTLSNIEIIVIDDGSTDGSSEIVDRYAQDYPQSIRAFHKPNGGLSDARNFGLEQVVGEYIAFVDSDDWIESTMFEEMYEKAVATDSDVVVCSGVRFFDNYKKKSQPIKLRGNIDDFDHNVLEKPGIIFTSYSYAWNKIYRRHLFSENRHRFPFGQWFEDSAIIYNVLADANRVACVPKYFYHYRASREGAISNSVSPKIFDVFKSCDSILSYYRKKNVQETVWDVLEQVICSHLFARFDLLYKGIDKPLARTYINRTFVYLNTHFPSWKEHYNPPDFNNKKLLLQSRKNILITYLYLYTPHLILNVLKTEVDLFRLCCKIVKNLIMNHYRRWLLKREGFTLLSDLQQIFNSISVVYFVDFGTLLGFVRDKKFIPHDIDIDIGVIATNEQKIDVRAALVGAGYRLWRSYYLGSHVVEESYHFLNKNGHCKIKFDVNYYENGHSHAKTWLFYRDPNIQYAPRQRSVVEMVYRRIEGVTNIQVHGNNIPIPINSEYLLEEKYGPNWRKPDPEWIYWESPAARKIDELGGF